MFGLVGIMICLLFAVGLFTIVSVFLCFVCCLGWCLL